jgi:putative flippase GtrA
VRRFAKFAVVGASNTILSAAVFVALTGVQVPGPPAAVAAFACGAVNGYVWNRRWTFRAAASPSARARYAAVQLGALSVTSLAALGGRVFYVVALGCVTCATFAASSRWAFGGPRSG